MSSFSRVGRGGKVSLAEASTLSQVSLPPTWTGILSVQVLTFPPLYLLRNGLSWREIEVGTNNYLPLASN